MIETALTVLVFIVGGVAGWRLRARRDSKVIRDLRRQREWESQLKPKRHNVSRDAISNTGKTRVTKAKIKRRRMHFTNRTS